MAGRGGDSTNDVFKPNRSSLLSIAELPQREQGKPKVPRSTSPEHAGRVAEVAVKSTGLNTTTMPPEEINEMDAAEAEQFRAAVQGDRHQEVGQPL